MIGTMAALNQADKERVMAATELALHDDYPQANPVDAAEFMYQMATIAGQRWASIPAGAPALVSAIKASPQYKNLLTRLQKTGTVYASTEDRALSPYATHFGGGVGSDFVAPGVGAVIGYFVMGKRPMGALIGAAIGFAAKKFL